MLDVSGFSSQYRVRRMTAADADAIYALCLTNPLYYQHCPPAVTPALVLEDLTETPPGKTAADKYYVGFYDAEKLIAVMDLVDGYPRSGVAFIGFFMTDAAAQGRGVGSSIIAGVLAYLSSAGFSTARLAWVKGNPQAEHFWLKNGFVPVQETDSPAGYSLIVGEHAL